VAPPRPIPVDTPADLPGGAEVPDGWDCHVHVFDADAPLACPGHYRPATRTVGEIEALAALHGIGRLVLVQPSVYGTDNRLLRAALRRAPGRHRGVAVIDEAQADDALLDAMHAEGVRGVRFNLVSPVGRGPRDFQALAPRLRARGWHAQWYAAPEQLATVARLHAGTGVACVLDHLGGMHAEIDAGDAAWAALGAIADVGGWVKLSGWYRLRAAEPYGPLHARIQRVAELFGAHCVWGSDWPHTCFAPEAMPAYASTLAPAVQALASGAMDRLLHAAPWALYR
jgi:predicted TIM-barrel fold metal-dependent hydrolase